MTPLQKKTEILKNILRAICHTSVIH